MAKVLVVGAGPVGLTAAIELSRQGHPVKIIDKSAKPTQLSRAIGINSRTLTLLEPSKMTEKFIAKGIKIYHANMYCKGIRRVYANLKVLGKPYNFMLALPQDETETILEEKLKEFGVNVDRNTEFVSLKQDSTQVKATWKTKETTVEETFDYLIGADGAHSVVRKSLELKFEGFTYEDPWNLVDVQMTWKYHSDEAYSFIDDSGTVLVVIPIGIDRYRILGTMPDVLAALPQDTQVKSIFWKASFKVSCRQVKQYNVGRVFLAGDAAHVHSPIGGRGMNLGIEDACVLAQKMTQGTLDSYSQERHKVGQHVVKTTDRMFDIITTKNPLLGFLRDHVLFFLLNQPTLQKQFFKEMLGMKN